MSFRQLILVLFFCIAALVEPISGADFIRQMPDQRVPFQEGKEKTTAITLQHLYDTIDDFQATAPIITLENEGKTDIVKPEIVDNNLVLHWKTAGHSEITLRIENTRSGKMFFDKVNLDSWEPNYWAMSFVLLGGIGIFLLGMKYVSDGLQLVAGAGLRNMVAAVTDNRFSAVLVGIIVTITIQSSTATTVMVVGFVNSQIMTLAQGIGVIMGANIGTTVTGWLLTLSLSKYGLPILGAAAMVYLFSRIEKTRLLAMVVMGVGCVFFGLELMQSGFVSLKDLPSFAEFLKHFSASTFGGVWVCILTGCLITVVLQASSATLGITISLASLGAIQFDTAAALVLGENIGTTLTAILASFGASVTAKRAACFHALFNVSGVIWISMLFHIAFLPVLYYFVGTDPDTGVIRDPKIGVALAHSLFNITNTILYLPFVRLVAGFLEHAVADNAEDTEVKKRITSLSTQRMEPTAMAIERSRIEVIRMGNRCLRLCENVLTLVKDEGNKHVETDFEAAFHQESELDLLQDEIIAYTSHLLSGNISQELGEAAHQQLRMADELESISDYLIVILKSHLKLKNDSLVLPPLQENDFAALHSGTETFLAMILRFYSHRRTDFSDLLLEMRVQGDTLNRRAKAMRDVFVKQISAEQVPPNVIIAFNTIFNAYRRVREHAQNLAEAIAGVK